MQREDRQHPPKLRAKFKHYASRIRAIPPGGKMPAALIADAQKLILQRMDEMTAARPERVYLITDETAPLPSQAEMVAAMRKRFDCTPKQLIEPSRSGYSTNDKPCPMLVHTHQTGAEE